MTKEEKQALIEHAKSWIADAEAARDDIPFGFDEDTEMELSLIKIALAALTALPVSIKNSDFESALTLLNDVLDDCGDSERGLLLALSRMGIEVQE